MSSRSDFSVIFFKEMLITTYRAVGRLDVGVERVQKTVTGVCNVLCVMLILTTALGSC